MKYKTAGKIDVEQLMHSILDKNQTTEDHQTTQEETPPKLWSTLSLNPINVANQLPKTQLDQQIGIVELEALHGEQFIEACYKTILGRMPDESGSKSYLTKLTEGDLTKIEIMGRLSLSQEGRKRKHLLPGLIPRYVIWSGMRIPVLGGIWSWIYSLIKAPVLYQNHQRLEQAVMQQQVVNEARLEKLAKDINIRFSSITKDFTTSVHNHHQAFEHLDSVLETLESHSADHGNHLGELSSLIGNQSKAVEALKANLLESASNLAEQKTELQSIIAMVTKLESHVSDRDSQLENLESNLSDIAQTTEFLSSHSADHGTHLGEIEKKLNAVQVAMQSLETSSSEQARIASSQTRMINHLFEKKPQSEATSESGNQNPDVGLSLSGKLASDKMDMLYLNLEDKFRGSRDDVISRIESYKPLLTDFLSPTLPVSAVDLGCGRGEWLEVTKKWGIECTGIDISPSMTEYCLELGYDAKCCSALEYLNTLDDESLDILTGFHVIEHMRFEDVIHIMEQAQRVLKNGGILILETPNPENLLVGACNFYYDPSHRNPLPPGLLAFSAECAGFYEYEIQRLNADQFISPFDKEGADQRYINLAEYLEEKFLVGPDYALTARKRK